MKFVCERCHTKYSIADEKVRGKVLKVRCKTCANVITVRETGASIDDVASAGPKEAPIARSGHIQAAPAATGPAAKGNGSRTTRTPHRVDLPAAALVAPGTPAAAPPPRRHTPPPPPPLDTVDWYLAVDGAQTGPFPRSRLIDKILATPTGADVHVWNADLDGWKPPKDVSDLAMEVQRRRRSQTPVPPPPHPPTRRPTGGGLPLFGAEVRTQESPDIGAGLFSLEADTEIAKAPAQKRNGFASVPAVAASAATATATVNDFGLGDLLGGGDTGATPMPSASELAKVRGEAAAPVVSRFAAPAVAAPLAIGGTAALVAAARGRQLRLVLGALGVVVVLCGIVVFWMFKRPASATVAVGEPTAAKQHANDFAGLAERLAKEEAQPDKGAPPPVSPPPSVAVIDSKAAAAAARLEAAALAKGGKGKASRRKSTVPPPLSPAAAAALSAEQRDAASRFGDSFGRDVKLPTSTSTSSHVTPAQADISRVINNNRQGIQTCYQRALLRDNTLTHGKVTVRVSIGLSGKVKSVSLDAPAQFRALEPCIRDVMSRWAFPPSSEEYGTEFPVVLQGNQ